MPTRKILESFKKKFKTEWKKESFRFFNIMTVFTFIAIILFKKIPFEPSLIIIGIWIISYFKYQRLDKKIWNKKDGFEKGSFWLTLIIISICEIIFGLLIFCGGSQIALNTIALLIISGFFMLLIALIVWQFYSLYNIKVGVIPIIINYIILSLLLIILFAGLFITYNQNCGILDVASNTITNDLKNLLYFSSGNFYTLSYGDLIPICNKNRLLSQIEVAFSFIFHIIIISHLLSTLPNKQIHTSVNNLIKNLRKNNKIIR